MSTLMRGEIKDFVLFFKGFINKEGILFLNEQRN